MRFGYVGQGPSSNGLGRLSTICGDVDNVRIGYGSPLAEPLHERALSIREKALGPEHAPVAQSLNNLVARASVLSAVERWYDFPEFGGYLGIVGLNEIV